MGNESRVVSLSPRAFPLFSPPLQALFMPYRTISSHPCQPHAFVSRIGNSESSKSYQPRRRGNRTHSRRSDSDSSSLPLPSPLFAFQPSPTHLLFVNEISTPHTLFAPLQLPSLFSNDCFLLFHRRPSSRLLFGFDSFVELNSSLQYQRSSFQ